MTRRLLSLGEHVARQEDALLERALRDDEARRRAIAERSAARRDRSRSVHGRPIGWLAAAVVICLLVVFTRYVTRSEEALSFVVGDAERPGVENEWMSAPADGPLELGFSDGSTVTLEPDARARVGRLLPSGAELVVESGRASFDVEHTGDTGWRVRTGPFVVKVTGTRFDVEWNPASDLFTLELHEGRVVVEGCAIEGQAIEAGQVVRASCNPSRVLIASRGELEAGEAKPAEPTPRPAAPPAPDAEGESVKPPPVARSPRDSASPAAVSPQGTPPAPVPVAWTALARQGLYDEAYRRASEVGFDSELERRSAGEVLLLGDAARLSGHVPQARHAYRRARARFSGSGAAARAAFMLGRLESEARGAASAAHWFETYLREAPRGSFAASALGRLLEAAVERGDQASAIRIARSYLEQYPTLAHADEAREILESASPSD